MKGSIVPPPSNGWAAALQQHRDAAEAVLETVSQVAATDWDRPVAPGKWSPAEITEHLRLTAAALRHELETGEGMRIRTKWLTRLVIRALYLRRILASGRFPAGARAVREIQPRGGPFEQRTTTLALDQELRVFERALGARPDAHVTHPLFGSADARTALRFCTVHLLHHRGQIAQLVDRGSPEPPAPAT